MGFLVAHFVDEAGDPVLVLGGVAQREFGGDPVQVVFQAVVDFFAHGVHLPRAAARGDDEVIEFRGQFAEVENLNVASLVIVRRLGGG